MAGLFTAVVCRNWHTDDQAWRDVDRQWEYHYHQPDKRARYQHIMVLDTLNHGRVVWVHGRQQGVPEALIEQVRALQPDRVVTCCPWYMSRLYPDLPFVNADVKGSMASCICNGVIYTCAANNRQAIRHLDKRIRHSSWRKERTARNNKAHSSKH